MTTTLIVILLCLAVQRFIKLPFEKPNVDLLIRIYSRWDKVLSQTCWWQGYWGILLLYATLVVLYVLVVATLTHFLGLAFTFLFNCFVLWCYLDAKPLPLTKANKIYLPEIFMNRYYAIFSVLFWYIILGPLGIMLTGETRKLCNNLKSQQELDVYFSPECLQKLNTVRRVMDWIPVRLVGLTYALVGHFRPAFQYWCRQLAGLDAEPMLIVDYGMVALSWDPKVTMSGSLEEVAEVESLSNRALCVWLAVLVIFTVGGLLQ